MNEDLPGASPVERMVSPRAWAAFTPAGNIRVWTSVPDDVRKLAAQVGVPLTPLYDQDAFDAAAAKRDCRTCARYTTTTGGCVSVLRCIGGNEYRATQPRQIWELRPGEPSPF